MILRDKIFIYPQRAKKNSIPKFIVANASLVLETNKALLFKGTVPYSRIKYFWLPKSVIDSDGSSTCLYIPDWFCKKIKYLNNPN